MSVAPVPQITITDTGMSALSKGMHLSEIRGAIGELEAACNRAIEANEDFTAICQLKALQGGVDPAVLKTFITARCNDRVKKTENKAEQLSILFDEIA